MKPALLCCVVALLSNPAVRAAVSDVRWSLDPEQQAIAEARTLLVESGAIASVPVTDLLVRIDIDIREEAIVERVRQISYYGTSEGAQNDGVVRIYWDTHRESLTLMEASTIDPTGRATRFDPANLRVRDDSEENLFTDQRIAILQLPGVREGAITVIEYERTTARVPDTYTWHTARYPASMRPRQRYEIELQWQGEPPVWRDESAALTCAKTGSSRLRCSARDIPPAALDPDVDYLDELPQFLIAERATWAEVVAMAQRHMNAATFEDEGVDALYATLTAGVQDIERAIEAIHTYVAREIRYVSYSEGNHTVMPHAVSATLRNRYGDCKDKSALLLALLARTRLDAYPVLVATDRSDVSRMSIPGVSYFDHMIVCLRYGDGERCLDPTDSYTFPDGLGPSVQGRARLNVLPGAVPTNLPADRYRWSLKVTSEQTFADDGAQEERYVRDHRGAYGSYLRSILASKGPAERLRWLTDDYQSTVNTRVEPEFKIIGADRLANSVLIESLAHYPRLADPGRDLNYVDADVWTSSLVSGFRTANRHYGYRFPGVRVEAYATYRVPSRWRVGHPGAQLDLRHEFGTMKREITIANDNAIKARTIVELPARWVAPGELSSFNRFLEVVAEQAATRVRARRQ